LQRHRIKLKRKKKTKEKQNKTKTKWCPKKPRFMTNIRLYLGTDDRGIVTMEGE